MFHGSAASEEAGAIVVKVPLLSLQRSSAFKQIFLERVAALTSFDHSLLVPVAASGRTHGLVWSASQAVHGWDADLVLAAMQRSGRRPTPRQVLTLGLRLADGLEALHDTATDGGPLVLGEMRPSKLIFTPEGDLRLLLMSAAGAAAGERSSSSTAERFAWRAPEQLLRQPETVRTDVRGLALLLFVLVTGSNPFQRRTTARTCSAILQDQVLFEGDANLSSSLSTILRGALSSDPERRPPNMRALASALRNELMRQGGDEPWSPWIVGLQIAGALNADREEKASADQDALMARLTRDAPRVESSHESAPTLPGRARATAPAAAPASIERAGGPAESDPESARMAAQLMEPDLDPTVLFSSKAAESAQASRRHEPSGFTLVPDDVETGPSAEEAPRQSKRDLRRISERLLPPEPETTEAVDPPTEEAPSAPLGGAAQVFAAGSIAGSSFVLVTDDPSPTQGLTVGPAGAQDSIPEDLGYNGPQSEEEEALLPAMSAEEGLAELARERAARGEFDDDEDDEASDDPDSPRDAQISVEGGSLHEAARVSLVGASIAQIHAPQPAARPVAPVAAPVPARVDPPVPVAPPAPVKVDPPRPVAPVAPPAPAKADPPRPVAPPVPKAEPVAPTVAVAPVAAPPVSPAPALVSPPPAAPTASPRPAPTVAKTEPVPRSAAPVEASVPPPATRPQPSSGRPAWLVPALLALVVLVVAVIALRPGKDNSGEDIAKVTVPKPEEPKPEEPKPEEPKPEEPKPEEPKPEEPKPDVPKPEEPKPPPPQPPKPPKPEVVPAGPPGLVSLKVSTSSDTRVVMRGTMRGAFTRPAQAFQAGVGPNGGDQYILTFRGVESQMSLTRIPVATTFVSGVQIVSSQDVLELRVLVAAGAPVNYAATADGFTITALKPRGP